MNPSKTGLNESFYKWIDQVRRSKRKQYELQEKLDFYNMKLIGYKGVSYEYTGSAVIDSRGDETLLYWLDKINEVEVLIDNNEKIIKEFIRFKSTLKQELRDVLLAIIERKNIQVLLDELSIKRSSYNQKKEEVIRLWLYYKI
jgi:hypothetical protein